LNITNSPLVTVIIPLFNRFGYTNRSIESVVNQNYKYWELIIIDDCSHQEFVLDTQYKELDNVFLYRNKENLGSGLSRQFGLNLARGKYVAFLDSDDFYHEDFLLKMVDAIKKSNGVIGIYCFSQFTSNNKVKSELITQNILPALFDFKRPWTTCAWLWEKSKISTWKNLRTNQDSLFEIDNALLCNNIDVVPDVLCYIDKETNENTIDLVGNHLGELNRNFVVNYAFDKIRKFENYENYESIKLAILNRMIFVSAKLADNGDKRIVRKNGLKLISKFYSVGFVILFVSFFIGFSDKLNNYCKKIIHKFG
jgi:glycosyltransferase involved in cell wall biosynthesis